MPSPPAKSDVQLSPVLGKFWTVANMLSLSRLILVIPITYLIIVNGPMEWVLGLILFGAVTDWFDGRIARWSGTVSEWGKVLDPLADKAAAAMIVMALVVRGSLPSWFLALILTRDISIVLGGVMLTRQTGRVVMSAWSGKVSVAALSLTVLAALFQAPPMILQIGLAVTTVLLLYSAAQYFRRFSRLMRGEADEMEAEPADSSPMGQQAQATG